MPNGWTKRGLTRAAKRRSKLGKHVRGIRFSDGGVLVAVDSTRAVFAGRCHGPIHPGYYDL